MADILPVLLKYQRGEKFTELVFEEKKERNYYSEELNVPVTGTFSEPKEASGNKITDSLIKRKYFLYQRDLTEERVRILYEKLKGSGYSVLKVKIMVCIHCTAEREKFLRGGEEMDKFNSDYEEYLEKMEQVL